MPRATGILLTKRSIMPPPAVPDDLIEEILLRFPQVEPHLLVRAALVCKRWSRLISDPRFRRRFRELHRAAPMLGFFCTDGWTSRFVPTSSVPRHPRQLARRGRVLLEERPRRLGDLPRHGGAASAS